jgi:hypothetical protein
VWIARDDADAVLDAMIDLEVIRVARYQYRPAGDDDRTHQFLAALLARHAVDAQVRLGWLLERRRVSLARGKAA